MGAMVVQYCQFHALSPCYRTVPTYYGGGYDSLEDDLEYAAPGAAATQAVGDFAPRFSRAHSQQQQQQQPLYTPPLHPAPGEFDDYVDRVPKGHWRGGMQRSRSVVGGGGGGGGGHSRLFEVAALGITKRRGGSNLLQRLGSRMDVGAASDPFSHVPYFTPASRWPRGGGGGGYWGGGGGGRGWGRGRGGLYRPRSQFWGSSVSLASDGTGAWRGGGATGGGGRGGGRRRFRRGGRGFFQQGSRGRGYWRGRPGFRRGRGRFASAPPATREELDKELDDYMKDARGTLDRELDEYMSAGAAAAAK